MRGLRTLASPRGTVSRSEKRGSETIGGVPSEKKTQSSPTAKSQHPPPAQPVVDPEDTTERDCGLMWFAGFGAGIGVGVGIGSSGRR